MVEIDTPGHTSAIANAHPDYIACPGATPWATYANGTSYLHLLKSRTQLTAM